MTEGVLQSAPAPKVDPETLVLRGSPRRAVRFRKGLLIGIAGAGAASIAAIAWVALRPAGLHLAANPDELYSIDRKTTPEALNRLPGSYGQVPPGVPRLGPPLPGDLGRPILDRQGEMAAPGRPDAAADSAAQAAESEHQRRMAEARQARGSPVLMQLARGGGGEAGSAPIAASSAAGDAPAADGRAGPAGQGQNLAFMNSRDTGGALNPHALQQPASRWLVSAGTVIAASLLTGLDSDLPGLVVAQVSEPVADSATGRTTLIPQGSRLIGRYDSVVAFGQRRALVIWQRIVLPGGASIELDNFTATDAAGYAGVADSVDFHTWRVLGGIGLSTLLGVGTQLTFGTSEADLVRALRESAQQNADRAGQRIVERNLDIQPTIRVRPGFPLRVLVHKDIVLAPWRNASW
jgi:type IV secretion system protein VirB10